MTIKEFGPLLERLRFEANLSRAALAQKAGIDPSLVKRYENGEGLPTETTLEKLATVLPIPLEECKALYDEYQKDFHRRSTATNADRRQKKYDQAPEERRTLANEELDAVAWKAGQMGTSYGKLAATLTVATRKDIIREFRAWKRKAPKERKNTGGRAFVSTVSRSKR